MHPEGAENRPPVGKVSALEWKKLLGPDPEVNIFANWAAMITIVFKINNRHYFCQQLGRETFKP